MGEIVTLPIHNNDQHHSSFLGEWWFRFFLKFIVIFGVLFGEEHLNWNDDIDFIQNSLLKTHPNPFFKLSEKEFYQQIQKLKQDLNLLTEEEKLVQFMQILAKIGDAHTGLLFSSNELPIRFYCFEEGIYVVAATEEYRNLIGLKLVSLDNNSVDSLVEKISTIVSHENTYGLLEKLPYYLIQRKVLQGLKISLSSCVNITFEDGKKTISVILPFLSFENKAKWVSIPISHLHREKNYWLHFFPNERILFFQYNHCREMASQSFSSFVSDFSSILQNDVRSVIVDLRFNGGGNSLLFTKGILPLLKNFEQSGGSLYVLIGRKTFSSGVFAVCDLLRETKAVTIGEPTGNKPNHFGEVKDFEIDHLVFRCSTKLWKNTGEEKDACYPMFTIPIKKEEVFKGIDKTLLFAWEMAGGKCG